MKPIFTVTILAALLLVGGPALADERFEAWQERVIRALEEAGEAQDGNTPKDSRGNRPGDKSSLVSPKGDDAGARKAAARAERNFGGRALAVQRRGDAYRVRLLLDDGRVKTVTIED